MVAWNSISCFSDNYIAACSVYYPQTLNIKQTCKSRQWWKWDIYSYTLKVNGWTAILHVVRLPGSQYFVHRYMDVQLPLLIFLYLFAGSRSTFLASSNEIPDGTQALRLPSSSSSSSSNISILGSRHRWTCCTLQSRRSPKQRRIIQIKAGSRNIPLTL